MAGTLDESMEEELAAFTAAVLPSETVIRGSIRDQAELHGVLDRLQRFGLELVEVRRLPDGE